MRRVKTGLIYVLLAPSSILKSTINLLKSVNSKSRELTTGAEKKKRQINAVNAHTRGTEEKLSCQMSAQHMKENLLQKIEVRVTASNDTEPRG